jgi:dihydroflavonol-4-reductase
MDRVLLTGVTGYIGQHCAAELLRQGYKVVGTIRSRAKADATRIAIARVAPVDSLSFVEADLLSDRGWAEAMTGCTFVMHVASPFVLAQPKDENEMIVPAVEGTKRVMAAAQRARVKRLVLTSSTFAIIAGRDSGRYGTDAWSDTNASIGAYAKSKTLAERAAWAAAKHGDMELTVINPGAVFGPSLGATMDGQSVTMMTAMIRYGRCPRRRSAPRQGYDRGRRGGKTIHRRQRRTCRDGYRGQGAERGGLYQGSLPQGADRTP